MGSYSKIILQLYLHHDLGQSANQGIESQSLCLPFDQVKSYKGNTLGI